jgi:hypothetical protein
LTEIVGGRELDQNEVILLYPSAASKLSDDALRSLYYLAHNSSPIRQKSSKLRIMMSEMERRKYKVMDGNADSFLVRYEFVLFSE